MNFYGDLKLEYSQSQINSTQAHSEKYADDKQNSFSSKDGITQSADDKQKWYSKKKGIAFVIVGILVLSTGVVLLLNFGSSNGGRQNNTEIRNSITPTTKTQTKLDKEGGNIPTSYMGELIYFMRRRSDNHFMVNPSFDLCSVNPDGSGLKLRHERLPPDYVVSNAGETLFYLSRLQKGTLFSVDLTKGPGGSAAKIVLELKNDCIASFSVSLDGSKVVFATFTKFKTTTLCEKIQMVEFINEKWTEPRDIYSNLEADIKLSPKFNGKWIFYKKLLRRSCSSEICKIDLVRFPYKQQCEAFSYKSLFLSSNENRYVYSEEGKLLLKTFGSQQFSKEFAIPSVSNGVGLMVHQWEDDGIYFSFNGPSVKILRRLNFENREVTLVLDEGKNEIVVVC